MGANIKYAGSRHLRGIRLFLGAILVVSSIKFVGLARHFGWGYDAVAYNWMLDTSVLPSISQGSPDKHHAHQESSTEWKGYSLKPIAYVFPQYHAIPENDKFWGVNFTEWVNVRGVEANKHGLKTMRPTEEIGYYNLLDYDVRERYGKLVRDSG